MVDFLHRCQDVLWDRTMFLLAGPWEGKLCLGPSQARREDRVCILYGCNVPVLLRERALPSGDRAYELVGETYIYGLMDGEALDGSTDGASREFMLI